LSNADTASLLIVACVLTPGRGTSGRDGRWRRDPSLYPCRLPTGACPMPCCCSGRAGWGQTAPTFATG